MKVGSNVPSAAQTQYIIAKITSEKNLKMIDSTSWYGIYRTFFANRTFAKVIGESIYNLLKSRFVFLGGPGCGILLCPYTLGASESKAQRATDLSTLAHELTHYAQAQRLSWATFTRFYVTKSGLRAHWEMQAACAAADMNLFLGYSHRNNADHVFSESWREMYCLTDALMSEVKEIYEHNLKKHDQGRWIEPAAGELIKLIQEDV